MRGADFFLRGAFIWLENIAECGRFWLVDASWWLVGVKLGLRFGRLGLGFGKLRLDFGKLRLIRRGELAGFG